MSTILTLGLGAVIGGLLLAIGESFWIGSSRSGDAPKWDWHPSPDWYGPGQETGVEVRRRLYGKK